MSEERYIVSARKYRPGTFASVVGQTALTHTLKNAIDSGRLAQAYLFCGPRGVGKTSCARIFAKTINCLHPTSDGEACGECESCEAIRLGNSYNLIELDAASNNSVNDIRALIEQVNIPPTTGKYKVFIIDEVHMLSPSAFNAFLKTLEEPPRHAIFIMATTEKHKVLPTILSRCQIYDFKRITVQDMVAHLQYVAAQEGIEAEERALNVIARKADGAMRDALSIFDQIAASTGGHITYDRTIENLNVLDDSYFFELTDAFADNDIARALVTYAGIREKGFDSQFFLNGLAAHLRNLMMMYDPRTAPLLELSKEEAERYRASFSKLPLKWYYQAVKLLAEADLNYRQASNKQLHVEIALIRLSSPFEDGASDGAPLPKVKAVHLKSPSAPKNAETADPKREPQAPPAVQSPVATPPAPPADSPAPRRRRTVGGATFRLSDSTGAETRPERRDPVTAEKILEGLTAYTGLDSETRTLETLLPSLSLRMSAEEEVTIDVPHQGVGSAIGHQLPRLLPFLKDRLGNDRLSVRVEVKSDTGPRRNREEVFSEMMANNPVLAEFLQKTGFKI